MAKKLMKGSEAIGEAAIRAGCKLFFGYPITPQNEIPEYMSHRLPQVGGTFVQAESEVAASNMIYGAAGTRRARLHLVVVARASRLMKEAISYIAGAELPVVIVNIMRGGPGLGGILPSQADYFQATKGGGHGDYRLLVLAPSSVQEAADLVQDAFDLADNYRNPVMILGDGLIGQMMEPVEFSADRAAVQAARAQGPGRRPAATGRGRPTSSTRCSSTPRCSSGTTSKLTAKYDAHGARRGALRGATAPTSEYDVLLVAYGTVARVCPTAIEELRERGRAGRRCSGRSRSSRSRTRRCAQAAERAKAVLVVEMSIGQMVEDVQPRRRRARGRCTSTAGGRHAGHARRRSRRASARSVAGRDAEVVHG